MYNFKFSIGTAATGGNVQVETDHESRFVELVKKARAVYETEVAIPKTMREMP